MLIQRNQKMLIQRNQKKKESINVNSKGLEKKGKYKP